VKSEKSIAPNFFDQYHERAAERGSGLDQLAAQ